MYPHAALTTYTGYSSLRNSRTLASPLDTSSCELLAILWTFFKHVVSNARFCRYLSEVSLSYTLHAMLQVMTTAMSNGMIADMAVILMIVSRRMVGERVPK